MFDSLGLSTKDILPDESVEKRLRDSSSKLSSKGLVDGVGGVLRRENDTSRSSTFKFSMIFCDERSDEQEGCE